MENHISNYKLSIWHFVYLHGWLSSFKS